MRRAASVTEFVDDPVGCWFAGRAFVAWMLSPALVGASHIGPFDAADEPELRALFGLVLHPALIAPYDVVHDLGDVELIDRRAFDLLHGFLSERMTELATRARRLAVVRPAGLAGAAFTGLFHDFASTRFDAQLFADRGAAYAWLGVIAGSAARAELDAVTAPFDVSPLLRRIRELIADDPRRASLERVAAAAGQSARSLQRHLADHGTSFRDELGRARVIAAKALLAETDDKVESIARELGFASAAAFTAMFGRELGESPQAFRDKRRR